MMIFKKKTPKQTQKKKPEKPAPATEPVAGGRPNRKLRPELGRYALIWILLMAAFFAESLGYVWCRVQCVHTAFVIDAETRRHQELVRARNLLKVEHALLKSPERIETIARTRLDLVRPGAEQTVVLP